MSSPEGARRSYEDGGSPVRGEPLAIEFVNTSYTVRGVPREGLRTPSHLARWLQDSRARFEAPLSEETLARIGAAELECVLMLRDAARRLISASVRGGDPHPWDVAQLNRASSLTRAWPLLSWEPGARPLVTSAGVGDSVVGVQCELAQAVLRLLGGEDGSSPAACEAPGCVLYFDRGSPRREWCSTGCGNRARAARHYARHSARAER